MWVPRLGVVGLLSLDRVDGGIPRLGGAPWYAARALRLLGHPAVLVTKLAEEDSGRGLHALGLPVFWRPAARTIAFRIENTANGRLVELEEPGEPWSLPDAEGWVRDALAGCDWVHAGALSGADFTADVLAALRRGRRLSLDGQGLVRPSAAGVIELSGHLDPDLLQHVDVLKLSEDEADALGLTLDERSLRSVGVAEIVVTLADKGCVVYADGVAEHLPARPLEVRDPTGAGDEFMAAYLSYRSRRHAPTSAAHLAGEVVRRLLADSTTALTDSRSLRRE
jgi:sugar/nucleoside kinase (ribokinase family)